MNWCIPWLSRKRTSLLAGCTFTSTCSGGKSRNSTNGRAARPGLAASGSPPAVPLPRRHGRIPLRGSRRCDLVQQLSPHPSPPPPLPPPPPPPPAVPLPRRHGRIPLRGSRRCDLVQQLSPHPSPPAPLPQGLKIAFLVRLLSRLRERIEERASGEGMQEAAR